MLVRTLPLSPIEVTFPWVKVKSKALTAARRRPFRPDAADRPGDGDARARGVEDDLGQTFGDVSLGFSIATPGA